MKILYLVIVFMAFGTTSCKWTASKKQQRSIAKDTLNYTYKFIKHRAFDCGNKSDNDCTIIKIKYPVFKTQKVLKDSIQKFIISQFQLNNQSSTDVEKSAKHYIDEYNQRAKNPDPGLAPFDYIRLSVNVVRQDSGFVAIQVIDNGYPPNVNQKEAMTFTYISNWDIKKNTRILLKDILIKDYEENLNRIAEPIFRKEEKLNDTVSLDHAFDFKIGNDKFTPYDNFLITPIGLCFFYNPLDMKPFYNRYDMKRYDDDSAELIIPYTKIKKLLKPHTVVTQYTK
jgi:hypothetical protein